LKVKRAVPQYSNMMNNFVSGFRRWTTVFS
jgi:hypothetical protein